MIGYSRVMRSALTTLLWLLATVLAVGVPTSASACRTIVPNDATLAKYENIVVVTIYSGTRLTTPGWNTWRLTALRSKPVAGSISRPQYSFTTAQSSSGCGVTPLPGRGEKWVIYSSRSNPGRVLEAYPLALAGSHDPRLANVR